MSFESRRNFLAASGKLIVGTVALGTFAAQARASQEHAHMPERSGIGLAIDAKAEDTCATCKFWGGMRKISEDKAQVITQSMGWCNNPKSRNHGKLTAADNRMKKPDIWGKWSAL
jgi:anaerobic selenocysteine-containing dehydrogenase